MDNSAANADKTFLIDGEGYTHEEAIEMGKETLDGEDFELYEMLINSMRVTVQTPFLEMTIRRES